MEYLKLCVLLVMCLGPPISTGQHLTRHPSRPKPTWPHHPPGPWPTWPKLPWPRPTEPPTTHTSTGHSTTTVRGDITDPPQATRTTEGHPSDYPHIRTTQTNPVNLTSRTTQAHLYTRTTQTNPADYTSRTTIGNPPGSDHKPQFTRCLHQTGTCSCETDKGDLDLSPLDTKVITSPRFWDIVDVKGKDMFSYNPCSPFQEGGTACKENVALCQRQPVIGGEDCYYHVGNQSSSQFVMDPNKGLMLKYHTSDRYHITRTSYVQLVCDPKVEAEFIAYGETGNGTKEYEMVLISKYACPGEASMTTEMTPPPHPTHPPCDCYTWKLITLLLTMTLCMCLTLAVIGLCLHTRRKPSKVVRVKRAEVPYQKF